MTRTAHTQSTANSNPTSEKPEFPGFKIPIVIISDNGSIMDPHEVFEAFVSAFAEFEKASTTSSDLGAVIDR